MNLIIEDKDGIERAEIKIDSINKNLFIGQINKQNFSKNQIQAFKEFEDLVNNQVFSLVDKVQEQIALFGFRIKGETFKIYDLQVYNLKECSFRKKD